MPKKKSVDPTAADVIKALEPDEPPRDVLQQAVEKALASEELDISLIPDDDLEKADTVSVARQTWVLSYLRIRELLRHRSVEFNEKLAQAKVAQNYIRHAETTQREMLALGKKREDTQFQARIDELRQQIEQVARKKAELNG